MDNKVFVVTYTIDESAFDDSWTNYEVIGCFYDKIEAYKFASEYEDKIIEEHKGQMGWGTPNCEVHETEIR